MSELRKIIFKLLCLFGLGKLLLFHNRKKQRIPILVFHKIIPEYDAIWPGIHPILFEEIIVFLKQHYRLLPIECLLDYNKHDLTDACFITFDDGYRDYLDYAYPILKKHNVPSSLFILPYQITNKGHIWTSAVTFFIKHYSFAEVNSYFTRLGFKVNDADPYNFFKINLEITKQLCEMKNDDRMDIINELRAKFEKDNRLIDNELLSFDEIRKTDRKLTYIGSHSFTHPSFGIETNENFIEYEMKESKQLIEREINHPAEAFAFPFANWSELSLKLAKKHYKLCFTGLNNMICLKNLKQNKDEIYNLHRFNIHHNSPEEVFFLINGFHSRFSL